MLKSITLSAFLVCFTATGFANGLTYSKPVPVTPEGQQKAPVSSPVRKVEKDAEKPSAPGKTAPKKPASVLASCVGEKGKALEACVRKSLGLK